METQKIIQNKISALSIISIIIGIILIMNQPILTPMTNPTQHNNPNKKIAIPISKTNKHTTFYSNNETLKIRSTEYKIGQFYQIYNQGIGETKIKKLKQFNKIIKNKTIIIKKSNEEVTIPLKKLEYKIHTPYQTKHKMKIYRNGKTQKITRKPKKPRIGEKYQTIGIRTKNHYLPIKIIKKIKNPEYKLKTLKKGEPIANKGIVTEKYQKNKKTIIKIINKYEHKIELTETQKYLLKNLTIKKGSKIQIRGQVDSKDHLVKNNPIEVEPVQIGKIKNKTQCKNLSNNSEIGKTYEIKGKVIEKTRNKTILQTKTRKIRIEEKLKPKILSSIKIKVIYSYNGFEPIKYQIIDLRQESETVNISEAQVGEVKPLKGKIREIDELGNGFLKLKLIDNSQKILVGVKKNIKNSVLSKISIGSKIKVIGRIDTYYGSKMIYPSTEEDVILID